MTESCIWKWSSCFVSVLGSSSSRNQCSTDRLAGRKAGRPTVRQGTSRWLSQCFLRGLLLDTKCLSIVADHLCGCYQSHSLGQSWGYSRVEPQPAAASLRPFSLLSAEQKLAYFTAIFSIWDFRKSSKQKIHNYTRTLTFLYFIWNSL